MSAGRIVRRALLAIVVLVVAFLVITPIADISRKRGGKRERSW